jgi:hypothetical protein
VSGTITYRVAVHILATNGVSNILSVIARDALGLGRQLDAVGAKLGKWPLMLGGVGLAVAGVGYELLKWDLGLAKAADRVTNMQQQLKSLGISGSNVDKMSQAAFAASQQTPMIPYHEALGVGRQAFGVFVDPAAAAQATAALVRATAVLQAAHIGGGDTAMANILKAGEMSGAFYGEGHKFEVEKMQKFVDAATKALELPGGGLLTSDSFRQAFRLAQPATYVADPQDMLTIFAEGTQQMKSSFGRGFGQMYRELMGAPISKSQAVAMEQTGLVKPGDIAHIGGGRAFLKPTAFPPETMEHPLQLIDKITATLVAHGDDTQAKIIADVNRIFNQSASRIVADMIVNMPLYQRTVAGIHAEPGIDEQYKTYQQSYEVAMKDLAGAWETMKEVIGGPAVSVVVGGLHNLTDAITGVSAYFNTHKDVAKTITGMLWDVGKSLIILGGVAVSAAVIAMIGPVGVIALLAAAIAALAHAFAQLNVKQLVEIVGAFGGGMAGARAGAMFGWPGAVVGAVGGAALGGYTANKAYNAAEGFAQGANIIPTPGLDLVWNKVDASVLGNDPTFKANLEKWGANNFQAAQEKYGLDWVKAAPDYIQNQVGQFNLNERRKAAVPTGTDGKQDGPIDVNVVHIHPSAQQALSNGVANSMTDGMSNNPTGVITHNSRRSYTPPGIGTSQGVLVR